MQEFKLLGGAAAVAILSLSSDATSQPAHTRTSLPTVAGRMEKTSSAPQLISHFSFGGGSLEDKAPPTTTGPKRVVTLGPAGTLDPATKSFLKIDGRGNNFNGAGNFKLPASVTRAEEFNIPEFTVSVFYFIEYLYGGGATGSQTCSWQKILTTQTFEFELNMCNYPAPYIRGGPVKYTAPAGQFVGTPKVWTHVALTRSATETKFYFRGALVGTAPSPPLPTNPSSTVTLGTSLYGAIDEFRFYTGVLDATTIAGIAQAGPSIDKVAAAVSPTGIAPLSAK